MRGEVVALDLETTGLDIKEDFIIEVGAVRIKEGIVVAEYSTLVNPGFVIPIETTHITGIYPEDLKTAPKLKDVLSQIGQFIGDAPIIAHGAAFDVGFLRRFNLVAQNTVYDTLELASLLLPRVPRYNLSALAKHFNIELENAHRALDDARATAILYWNLWERATRLPYGVLNEIVQGARRLNWEQLPFFETALQEQIPSNNALQLVSFAPLDQEYPPLSLGTAPKPIDAEAVAAVLDTGGAFQQAIPTYEQRPQQVEMARAVITAFNTKKHLLVEAGTGTGKSLAYLVPAFLWSTANQTRVVISTNTINLQDQLMHKDVPLTQTALQTDTQVALMKGRDNYLCPRRLAAVRRRQPANLDEFKTLAKLLVWLQESTTGDKSEINLRGIEHFIWGRLSARDEGCTMNRCATVMAGTCPFYKARKKAEAAQIVIANHALLIADAATENRVLPEYHYLIVDEAHQLEEAVTSGLGMRLDQNMLIRRLVEIGGVNSGILGDLLRNARPVVPEKNIIRLEAFIESISDTAKVMQAHVKMFFGKVFDFTRDATGEDENIIRLDEKLRKHGSFGAIQATWRTLAEYFEAVVDALQQLSGALNKLEKHNIPDFDDHLNSIGAAARYLQDIWTALSTFALQPDPNTIYWINANDSADYVNIQTAPLHIGTILEKHLWQGKDSVILTSATLQTATSFQYIRDRLFAETIETQAVGSPFDYQSSTLVYIPEDIAEPNRPGYQKAVERAIIDLATAMQGRVLVLFTSYSQLRETAAYIAPRLALGNITVYDQATGGNREALLDSFKSTEKAVMLGTKSFWEGVDIPGDDLVALVIVRLPFAVPSDPVFAARSETYNNPFKDFAVPDAILRFRQGFGRLIRTRTDRGIVVILDSRIVSKNYGMQFLESLPDCTIKHGSLNDIATAAKDWMKES